MESWELGFSTVSQCWDSQYIVAHNFLNIQPIFNPNKVLESWELGLFNCIDSVDIDSIKYIIFCTEYQDLYWQFQYI